MEEKSRGKAFGKAGRDVPTSNSSSESDQKRGRIESCKDLRRQQPSPKHSPGLDSTTKATRQKEDLRGGGTCGPFLRSYLKSQYPDNQVPWSDSRHSSSRRDGNKTDSASGTNEEAEVGPRSGSLSPREAVFVRETRASRLRAASRISPSDNCSPSPKPQNRALVSGSPTSASANRKDVVDKSHSRKSHLNRSHTSEGVYDDIYVPGGSTIRRRRAKNLSLESSPLKTADKSIPAMGNANGTARDIHSPLEHPSPSKTPLTPHRKPFSLPEKTFLKTSSPRRRTDDPKTLPLKPHPGRSPDTPKHIDIATRAEILAASTLKMINRLDEINRKARRTEDAMKTPSRPSPSTAQERNLEVRTEGEKGSADDAAKGSGRPGARDGPPKQDAKPSILKMKPPPASCSWDFQKPVSILKRKSLSQEDSQSSPPPVTFSPSVLTRETDMKRQGILKKRRSLDENEVMRRRSYSPDASYDFKSILKTQRRSSMEELTRRSHSPDSTPQGILKRKSSKEEDAEDEPQGILKRKSLPCLSTHHHHKITEGAPSGTGDAAESVRPILKKKSSSEEHSASEPSLGEVPKSILKKPSVEAEEPEEKPKKPILKSSRVPSAEEAEEERRPILKRENSRSGEGEEGVVIRRGRGGSRHDRPHSSSDIDSELGAIFLKRRSLEFQPVCAISFGGELQRSKKASSNERLKGGTFLSVAEKINNLENFLEVERMERERRNTPPGSPPRGGQADTKEEPPTAAASHLTTLLSPKDDREEGASPDSRTDEETSSFATLSIRSLDSSDVGRSALTRSSLSSKSSSDTLQDANSSPDLLNRISVRSTDSDPVLSPTSDGRSDDRSDDRYDTDCYFSLDSCGDRISSLSLKEAELMDSEDLFLLRKSGSVSAKTSLFKEMESRCRADGEGERGKREGGGSVGVNRRREKKLLEANGQRYHTQPVSTEEVELAVRESRSRAEEKRGEQGENHEDELCTMSYKDRLRLFESTLTPRLTEQRKRAARYKTQPVTTDEVETAKSHKYAPPPSSVAPPSTTHSEEAPSGVKSGRAEEKIRPKGILKNLKQSSEWKKGGSESDSSESEKRGILKSDLGERVAGKGRGKGEREVVSELKGILKQPSLEKRVGSSSEEESGREERGSSPKGRGGGLSSNLAALLQRVEPVGRGRGSEGGEGEQGKGAAKYLQNAGLARVINRARNSSLIVKSQSHSSVSSAFQPPPACVPPDRPPAAFNGGHKPQKNGPLDKDETDDGPLRRGLRRSTTLPMGPSDDSTDDDMSGASIQQRLARLKKSGEVDWQKRKSHVSSVEDELSVITAGNYLANEYAHLRDKQRPGQGESCRETEELKNSSSILADRLGKLDAAKEGWKKRIQPSDAVRFSVEGKMLEKKDSLSPPNAGLSSPTRTPLADRKKRSPKAARFRSKQYDPSLRSTPSSPSESISNPISRSVSAPGSGKEGLLGLSSGGDSKEGSGPVVAVPKNDDETFTSFFEGLSRERLFQERLEIKDEDLDAVSRMKSSQLLVQKRNIKTQKRRATVKNPVKALAARLDLQEYTEIKTAATDKELKRIKIERAVKNSTLAIEALAGLASQEDFTAVSLKKASEGGLSCPDAPYKALMLLQVKGRRHVQTRLVEPVARSVNAGDCFVLVTPGRLFLYVGEFANVIEKSRGAEICQHIQQTGDLGCGAKSVTTIGEGGRAREEEVEEFWALLGGERGYERGYEREAGNVDEDELFESALVDTNMVYEVVHDELVPVEAYWGSIPKIELLDPNKVLVFDFGSELYVWNGKNVSLHKRKVAVRVAKELWEEGFDYSECDLCPLTASSHHWDEMPDSQKAGPTRPGWALFAKITQNMETVLFREKFLDWPDYTRVIRRGAKSGNSQTESNGSSDIKPCEAKAMLENVVPEPDLVLEGSHLGRGVRHFDEETRRCSEIATKDVTVWHVKEFEYSEVARQSVGQFHMEDSYVVRWHYVITITGRELSGQPSKHLTTGRSRYAYFFWQGHDSPINDKGAAACITVELDKEHGPQVRVVQGLEPPAFLNLFAGQMVVHGGRRCSDSPCQKLRLFLCRGELDSEAALFEIPCSMRQLRSFASFLLVNKDTGTVIVWHGCKSPDNSRKIALNAAKRLRPETPEFEFTSEGVTVREEIEGNESQEFVKAVGGDNRQLYYSFLQEDIHARTPRLFHLTSVSGEFIFTEVGGAHHKKDSISPLPFLQNDLYSASQPALFLLDSTSGLWLWQGWAEDSAEADRGSGHVRFQAERRAAMSTALSYWSLKYGTSPPKAYLIWAGLEPLLFTNQFPFWRDRDDVAEINMKDGRKPGEAVAISTELATLTKSTYPLAQLLNRPLPDGVNPTSLEDYLEPQSFPCVFGMEKEDFLSLPSWKKKKLKQDVGLF